MSGKSKKAAAPARHPMARTVKTGSLPAGSTARPVARPAKGTAPGTSQPGQRGGVTHVLDLARPTGGFAGRASMGKGPQNAIAAELLIALAIIAMRAIADYVPSMAGTQPGTEDSGRGQSSPLIILSGVMMTFFVLSFAAIRGGPVARFAVGLGAVVDLALLAKSGHELAMVSQAFENARTHAQIPGEDVPPPPASAQPPSSTSPASGVPFKPKIKGNCPAGWMWDAQLGRCVGTVTGPPLT
jgi:hypothetical protein